MCCGVQWKVRSIDDCVPATQIVWKHLIQSSLVFPYLDDCYIFPFHLIWAAKTLRSRIKGDYRTREGIKKICLQHVANLGVINLYVSYDTLRQLDLFNLGLCYEKLLASSLAVKYYLKTVGQNQKSILLNRIYEFGKDEKSKDLLSDLNVDFSSGIAIPDKECSVNMENLSRAVIHNIKTRTAHHDIILPATNGSGQCVAIHSISLAKEPLNHSKNYQRKLKPS